MYVLYYEEHEQGETRVLAVSEDADRLIAGAEAEYDTWELDEPWHGFTVEMSGSMHAETRWTDWYIEPVEVLA